MGFCSSLAVPGSWFLGGVWMAGLLLCQVVRGRGTKRPGEEEVLQVELLPGARFRIPVQNPGSESGRSLGQRLGGEILLVP